MGFHYTGPIDGHDLPALLGALKTLRTLKGPQLLHVITTKGKGMSWLRETRLVTTPSPRLIRKRV